MVRVIVRIGVGVQYSHCLKQPYSKGLVAINQS